LGTRDPLSIKTPIKEGPLTKYGLINFAQLGNPHEKIPLDLWVYGKEKKGGSFTFLGP
jgi:hypothetical protein